MPRYFGIMRNEETGEAWLVEVGERERDDEERVLVGPLLVDKWASEPSGDAGVLTDPS